MIGLSHVLFQVGLCNPIARQAPDTAVAVRVRALDLRGLTDFDQTFTNVRGASSSVSLNVAIAPGTYRVLIEAPASGCHAVDFITALPNQDRSASENLTDGDVPMPATLLISGVTPALSEPPQFFLLDKGIACGGAIRPLDANVVVEIESGAYYASIHSDASLDARGHVLVVLRLANLIGEYHYVRLKVPFPVSFNGWPEVMQFDVTPNLLDAIKEAQPNTLLCPKLWQTSTRA